jgi:NTE family protein
MKKFSLFISLFLSFGINAIYSQILIKNLVFEGGGIRGVAYAGALQELDERKMLDSVERVAGTSAGAIAATLVAIGCTPVEISELISDLNIKKFADGKGIFIGGTKRLFKYYGWYKGEKFNKWLSNLIHIKTGKENITFRELEELSKIDSKFKQLFLTGTNLTDQKLTVFCSQTYPDMEIRTAVRVSISIPLFYQAVVLDQKGMIIKKKKHQREGKVVVDGGIIANYPIQIFDYSCYTGSSADSTREVNHFTLGFRLDRKEQIEYDKQRLGLAPYQIDKFRNYIEAFYTIIIENLNRQNLSEEDWKRTVSINTEGIGPKIKKLSPQDKDKLIQNGRKGVCIFFN